MQETTTSKKRKHCWQYEYEFIKKESTEKSKYPIPYHFLSLSFIVGPVLNYYLEIHSRTNYRLRGSDQFIQIQLKTMA